MSTPPEPTPSAGAYPLQEEVHDAAFTYFETVMNAVRRMDETRLKGIIDRETGAGRLAEALDTLTLIIGLTPIAGNKEALQEAMGIARAALAAWNENNKTP